MTKYGRKPRYLSHAYWLFRSSCTYASFPPSHMLPILLYVALKYGKLCEEKLGIAHLPANILSH